MSRTQVAGWRTIPADDGMETRSSLLCSRWSGSQPPGVLQQPEAADPEPDSPGNVNEGYSNNSKGGQAATYYARGTFNGSMFWGLLIGRSEIKNTTKLDANSSDSLLYVHLRHYGHDGITR